jgi:hypothetical protein
MTAPVFQGSYDVLQLERREAAIAAAYVVGCLPRPVVLPRNPDAEVGQGHQSRWQPVKNYRSQTGDK